MILIISKIGRGKQTLVGPSIPKLYQNLAMEKRMEQLERTMGLVSGYAWDRKSYEN